MIRAYKPSDKDKLLEIFRRNTPKYFDIKEVEDFEKYLEQNENTYFTIAQDNKIVGGTGYYVNEIAKSGSITWIFFDPDSSGNGLGRHAVNHCHTLLRNDKRVEKLVVTTSQYAYGFFEKFGYKTIKIEKDYWGQGLDLYEMEMSNK